MQTFTFDELKQAARVAADNFKKDLLESIDANDRHKFDQRKTLFDDALFGVGYLCLCISDVALFAFDECLEFRRYIESLQKEIRAIKWPER